MKRLPRWRRKEIRRLGSGDQPTFGASKNKKNPIKFTRRRADNDTRRKPGTNDAEAKQGELHGAGEPLAHIPLTDQERTHARELDPMGRCFSGATSKT